MPVGYEDEAMMQGNTRAQFLLASMLNEILAAFDLFHERRPPIIRRGLEEFAYNREIWGTVRAHFVSAINFIVDGRDLDWGRLEGVGLTGRMLEWKADLLYFLLGRKKPDEAATLEQLQIATPHNQLTYAGGKPLFPRLWKYAKSLFGSLIEALETNSALRAVLEVIKEYIEGIEASLVYVQEGEPS
jgi:hypothetical protein